MCFGVFARSCSRQGRRRTIQQPPPSSDRNDDDDVVSCSEQLNICDLVIIVTYKERPQRPVTFETYVQSDEENFDTFGIFFTFFYFF